MTKWSLVAMSFVLAASVFLHSAPRAQTDLAPVNDLPNPYKMISNWGRLPAGRRIGSSAAINVDKDGKSIWVVDRCGSNSCDGSNLDMVLKFDASGKLVKSFGAGLLVFPHGIYVDKQGNVWVTDAGTSKDKAKGQQIWKFSPDGKVLMTLGMAGKVGQSADLFKEPCDVIVGPNGDIYVSDSHSGQSPTAPLDENARVVKFTKDGKFIKSWGKLGSAPGEFRTPHNLAFDSQGRLFVADRGNNRIQIFDQDGNFIAEWKQFSRPSGLAIDTDDVLYVSDSESNQMNHPGGWKRGIRIGSARTGEVKYFIPQQPEPSPTAIPSGQEGITVDAARNIFGANVFLPGFVENGPPGEIKKYIKN